MATALRTASPADIARAELDAYLAAARRKSLLRFITCGSVDDGKSTLIGRLLYDSRMLFEDQLAALANDSRKVGATGEGLDLALLVDGLAAEREQGITIDVAYRFFTTDKRKFIVADTPGHEQYTRNMVTGASTADLAVILIDARKGVLTQTRRHSYLVHLLGIRSLVLAINKMDLVGNDQGVFDRIVADYRTFADGVGIESFTAIPLSGLTGDNVTTRSDAMPWYDGDTLLDHLETVAVEAHSDAEAPFRMAVQWVNRPNQSFRGYAGRIASGRVRIGDEIVVLPSGRRSAVASIVSFDDELAEAVTGQSVTLTLADELDCSRGNILVAPEAATEPVSQLQAMLVWMADETLVPHRFYWMKLGTQTVSASVAAVGPIVDVNSMEQKAGITLGLNDIGEVRIDLDRNIPPVRYTESRRLGGFILIDKVTHATVAAGLVTGFPLNRPRAAASRTAGSISWIVGANRASWARHAVERHQSLGRPTFVLDRESIGELVSGDEGDTLRRAREVAKLMSAAGVHVFVTVEAPSGEAHPGRVIQADDGEPGGVDEWVI